MLKKDIEELLNKLVNAREIFVWQRAINLLDYEDYESVALLDVMFNQFVIELLLKYKVVKKEEDTKSYDKEGYDIFKKGRNKYTKGIETYNQYTKRIFTKKLRLRK